MSTTTLPSTNRPATNALRLSKSNLWPTLGLGAIVLLAAILRFSNLAALGYVNHYYTAGITSMLQSWHNFFYVAAEPGGAVSIDKPPLGLWLQAISAYFLGVNGFALVLPEILSGLASIVVLYHLVQRSFGKAAGLLAALALAITPIVIATDRNNTIDSSLIFTLLLATWAFIKATETGKLRYLLIGAVLVGLGFNIKMMQAYLPLPALYALYFLGTSSSLRRKLLNLALTTVVLVAVSFSWAAVVDLTPASQRPYVGSSGSNSVMSLIFGYNGVERLTGMGFGGGPGGGGGPRGNNQTGQAPNVGGNTGQPPAFGNGQPPNFGGGNGGPQGGANGFGGPNGGGGRGGFPGTGQPGALRLFIAPLSKEVSWLLPFGLVSIVLLLLGSRLSWPLNQNHQAVVLWGGWLITGGVFFSIAGFFHEYYLSMLAAPLAALVGIGLVAFWKWRASKPWLAIGLLLLAAAATLGFQIYTSLNFVSFGWWLPIAVALFVAAGWLLIMSIRWPTPYLSGLGMAALVGALFLTPGIWSALTMLNSSDNQSLPAAYSGRTSGPSGNGGLQIDQTLLSFLSANTQDTKYLMAVPSSMQGADYVIATGKPVLYLGGFSGQDQVETADSLAQLVKDGELRYVYLGGGGGRGGPGGGGNAQASISSWVITNCTQVQGYTSASISAGAPDGIGGGLTNGGVPSFGGGQQMQISLYDCGASSN